MSLEIGPATDAEREWAARLMAGSEPWTILGRGLEQCRAILNDRDSFVFTARDGGRPRGFMILDRSGLASSPYVRSIAVSEEARGRGVGTRLMDFAEEYFRPRARHIFLCVSSFNLRARALYERLGYEVVGELKDYWLDGASEFLLHKRLAAPQATAGPAPSAPRTGPRARRRRAPPTAGSARARAGARRRGRR